MPQFRCLRENKKMAKVSFVEKQGPRGIGQYIQWKSEDGSIRNAREQRKDYPYPGSFSAAGKTYSSWKKLCAEELRKHGYSSIYRDIYGREVFVELREFPQRYSFDDSDWLGNERYYRHFYILKEDRLCHVVYEDKQKSIRVYEEESYLYGATLEKMRTLGWLEDK